MNNYIPTAILEVLCNHYIADHPSEKPVSSLSRGIRLLDVNEALIGGYLYVGKACDLQAVISKFDMVNEPVCIVTSGACDFFNEAFPIPKEIFLIESSMELIPLYNQVQDCYHRTSNQKPTKAGDIFVNQAFQELMNNILDERLTDDNEINAYLTKNNINVSRYFRLYTVRFSNTTNKGSIAWNYIISFIQQIFPFSYTATFNNTLIILDKHSHRGMDYSEKEKQLFPILEQYDAYFGLGNVCGHLVSVPAVYSQDLAAIDFGMSIDPNKRFYNYEDYAMMNVVELALQASVVTMHSRNPVHMMNNETVRILEYDAANNDNLIEILDCFLRYNCNLKNTSEALFIHRNTLRNKIEKIEEIMGRPLGNPTFEERLRFSCTTYRYMKYVLKEDPLKLRRNSEKSLNQRNY